VLRICAMSQAVSWVADVSPWWYAVAEVAPGCCSDAAAAATLHMQAATAFAC
jgi:hypothetical protein